MTIESASKGASTVPFRWNGVCIINEVPFALSDFFVA